MSGTRKEEKEVKAPLVSGAASFTVKDADLSKRPQRDPNAPTSGAVVLGDLDGNALKMIFSLYERNIIDISKKDYESLYQIYHRQVVHSLIQQELEDGVSKVAVEQYYKENYDYDRAPSVDDFHDFFAILQRIKKADKQSEAGVLLIGDDLCDRGGNDAFVLAMFDRLNQLNIQQRVVMSNHGVAFLKQYYKNGLSGDACVMYLTNESYGKGYFGQSMQGMRQAIEQDMVDESVMQEIFRDTYNPALRLLDYELDEANNCITLYSHAPTSTQIIEDLYIAVQVAERKATGECKVLNEPFMWLSAQALAESIDKMNATLQAYCDNKDFMLSLINSRALDDFVNQRFEDFNHNTQTDFLGFDLVNIHGHIGGDEKHENTVGCIEYCSIDSDFGMAFPARFRYESSRQHQDLCSVKGEFKYCHAAALNSAQKKLMQERAFEFSHAKQEGGELTITKKRGDEVVKSKRVGVIDEKVKPSHLGESKSTLFVGRFAVTADKENINDLERQHDGDNPRKRKAK